MSLERPNRPAVPGLAPEVLARVVVELGPRGQKVIHCLRTAAALLEQARENSDDGLRLAESAAYNLREAFDAVVKSESAPGGGLGEVVGAWKRYEIAAQGTAMDADAARAELEGILKRLSQNEERQGLRARQLLEFIRKQTGIEPLPGETDPTVHYNRLRGRAATSLHTDGTADAVSALYDEAIVWFDRFFTPPDERVRAIVALAEQPYAAGLVEEVRTLVVNAHDLRLLLSRLQDPEWLGPLCDAGLIGPPRAGEPWPVMSLIGGAGAIDPERIARLLQRLLIDSMNQPLSQRLDAAREIIGCAVHLGPAGYAIAGKIIARYPGDRWVQMVAASISRSAGPAEPIQLTIARALAASERASDTRHDTGAVLERLAQGLTADNAADRMKMLVANVRRLAQPETMRYIAIDTVALHTDNDDLREPVLILAQHLTRMIPTARALGLPTSDLLAMVSRIPGELGERVVCQALAGATDIDRSIKIGHIERRMQSQTVTGDDRDLINDILAIPLSPDELGRWRTAFGRPSPAPDPALEPDRFGDNWARAWRWSTILPSEVLEGWEDAIAAVKVRHGEPSPSLFDTPISRYARISGRPPHTHDEIAELPVADAAAVVSSWRPSENDDWGVSARELARELEIVVKASPEEWTDDPTMVVTTLREPVYVDHYFRAITQSAARLPRATTTTLLKAVKEVRAQHWEPTPLGQDDYDYEPDWSVVDTVTVEMIAALANHDGELNGDLGLCWELAAELVGRLPGELPDMVEPGNGSRIDTPLNRAINRPYGKALQAVLALGAWEHRNQGGASQQLTVILNEVLAVPGAVGLELRSVLASGRPLLEAIARDWLEANADILFATDSLGRATFDQTLMWSRPTKWFYNRFLNDLIASARRGADNAVSWLLIAMLWNEPGYTFQAVIDGLHSDVQALKEAADRMAALMQDIQADDAMATRGLEFWQNLLNADRSVAPAETLVSLGRWTFVDAVDDEQFLVLMDHTLDITGGDIDMASEIADRCTKAQPSSTGLRILRKMIGHGDRWEQQHVETAGVEALRAAATQAVDEEFRLLRSRLIQRGRHEVADIEEQVPKT